MNMEWRTEKISDWFEVLTGGTPRRSNQSYWGGDIRWMASGDINKIRVYDVEGRITKQGLLSSNAKILPAKTVLIALNGQGKTRGMVAITEVETTCNQSLAGLKPKTDGTILPDYLFWNLYSRYQEIRHIRGGEFRSGLNLGHIREITFPVPYSNGKPDFSEQQRLAKKLEQIFTSTRTGEAKATNNALLARRLFSSYLKSQIADAEIDDVELGTICQISGGFGFPHSHQGRKNEKYPFYKVSDMNTLGNEVYMKTHNHSVNDEDVKKLKLKIYPAGTIIFPKIGAAIATNKKRILSTPSTVDNNVMVLVPKDGVSSEYLYNHLLNFDLSDWSNKSALPSIRKSVVEKTLFPMPMKDGKPDYAAQVKFANSMKSFQEKAVLLERLSRANVEKLRAYYQSAFRSAFQPQEVVVPVAAPIVSPFQPIAAPRMFDIQQAVAQILKRFERGEMVVAKVLYLGQVLFGVPTNIQFSAQNFGPYDTAVKKAVTAGLSPRNKFFAKRGSGSSQVLTLGTNANNILKYSTSALARKTNAYLDQMLPLFNQSDSAGIERLATLCKIIEDERTADEATVKAKLQEWKPNKFTYEEVSRTLAFIKKQGWDQTLLK